MYLVINKCVTAVKVSNFSGHYLRNRSTLDMGVLGYIGILEHKEHQLINCCIKKTINIVANGSDGTGDDKKMCL